MLLIDAHDRCCSCLAKFHQILHSLSWEGTNLIIKNVLYKKKGVRLDHGASQVALVVKNPTVNARDARDKGSIPELGRSPGEGNGNSLQYSCLENSMDRGA